MNENNYDFFFMLNVLANFLQIANYQMLLEDSSNNDIMKELQMQDKMLAKQTNVYLKKIIEQNEEILRILKNKD